MVSYLFLTVFYCPMNMGTNNTCNNNVAFNNGNAKHNVSSVVQNKYIMIFQQKKVAVINTDWYFDLPEGLLWLNGMGGVTEEVLQTPDSKVHGANMGPTWVLSAPDGSHVGPMNLAIRAGLAISWQHNQVTQHVGVILTKLKQPLQRNRNYGLCTLSYVGSRLWNLLVQQYSEVPHMDLVWFKSLLKWRAGPKCDIS